MLNSLISRGPAGGDLPREGWESPSSFVRSTDLVLLPSFRHPFHPARFVKSEIYSKRNRNVYGRASLPRLSLVSPSSLPRLSPRGAWILGYILSLLPSDWNENSKFPSQGCTEGGRRRRRRKEGGRNIPPFRVEDLNILRCSSPTRPIRRRFSFAEEKEGGGERRGGRQKRGKRRKERKEGRKEGRTKDDPACQLNGTELKSFALRQARHVLASWAWQSSGSSSPAFPLSLPAPHLFSPPRYNWNSRKEWKRKEEEMGIERREEKRREEKKEEKRKARVLEAGTKRETGGFRDG